MNWINGFELMCYVIVFITLVHLVKKKDYNSLFTFAAASLVGFTMELLAVSVTDIYYYNNNFWLSLGVEPYQFPVFGGLMWGGLTVWGIQMAKKFRFNHVLTALTAGMIIVTMDILLDVVAIRLDGGFWVWVGRPLELVINNSGFFSVIWVNFLGYMIEVPTVTYLTLRKCEKVKETDWGKQVKWTFLIALLAIVVTGIGSLIALGLNYITNDYFSFIAFVILWLGLVVVLIKRVCTLRVQVPSWKTWNYPRLIFWIAMYGYCLAGIVSLGIHKTQSWFWGLGVLFMAATLALSIVDMKEE